MRDFNVQRRHLIDICLSLPAHSPSSPPPVLPLAHVCTPSMHFKKLLLPPSGVSSTEPYRILQEVFTSTRFPSSSTTPECSAVYCLLLIHEFLIVRHDDDDDSMDPESKLFMFIPSLTNIIYIATEAAASGL